MLEIVVTFNEDRVNTPKAVPRYHFRIPYGKGAKDSGLYGRIMQYTGIHDLAVGVESWAESASVGETYESEELTAEIINR